MNKFTKGAIATGAGIILLLGGAGSLAYWNSSVGIDAGDINSGTLTLTAGDTGWEDQTGPILDIDNFVIVPGDSLTFTGDYTIGATGDNLEATLDVDDAAFLLGLPADLAGQVDVTFAVVSPGDDDEITSADNTHVITVEVYVDFAYGATVDNDSQGETIDLSLIDITLTQHP